jgi:intracellular multiplication protein IcmK
LDPSATPVVILTAPGHVTTLTILDSTGAPWPIQDISWAGKFEITPPEDGGHIVRITPMSAHGIGNLSIRLVDLITPVTMSIRTGLDKVHYRFDARIPKTGPLAAVPIIESGGLKATAGKDDDMIGILDGTPASAAIRLKVEGTDGRTSVWKIEDRMYLRTPLTLLSPAWDSSVSSADGMKVYTVPSAPVVLLSDQGRMVSVSISQDEDMP